MSGGSPSSTTNVQKFEPPANTQAGWDQFVNQGTGLSNAYATDPSLIYGNAGQPMVAQMSDLQNNAANGYNALASAIPWQQQQQTGLNSNDLLNAFMYNGGINSAAGQTNPYAGDNPYMQAMLDASNADITKQFQNGTAAQTDAAAARGGAYGGSGYEQQQALNAKGLAQALAQNESNVRGANYTNSSNLAENAINRQTQAQEGSLGRGMQALQMNNQTNQAQQQSLAGLMGAGDLQQQTQQQNIQAAQNLFNANVQQPVTALDMLGSILQRASGQGGTTTSAIPGQNPMMGLLGSGMAAYGLFGGH